MTTNKGARPRSAPATNHTLSMIQRERWLCGWEPGAEKSLHASYLERREAISAAAARLGVEAQEVHRGRPWILTGSVDGRAFYAKSSVLGHRIVLAPDDQADVCPLDIPSDRRVHVYVRTGYAGFTVYGDDYETRLTFIVTEIRDYLLRASCEHPDSVVARYCPRCGGSVLSTFERALPADRFTRSAGGDERGTR